MPKGEGMTRSLSSQLADNSAKFGYSDAVVKSLKMELHAVSERIRYVMFQIYWITRGVISYNCKTLVLHNSYLFNTTFFLRHKS